VYFDTIFLYVLQIQKLFLVLQNINNLKLNIMKKLILILLLLPLFCSSQTILKDVGRMCIVDENKNTRDCTEVVSNMSILIENDFLIIKSDVETTKHQIDAYYVDKKGNKLSTFDVILDGRIQTASYMEDNICKAFFIIDSSDNTYTSFFDYK
jgi:hypothetical protein